MDNVSFYIYFPRLALKGLMRMRAIHILGFVVKVQVENKTQVCLTVVTVMLPIMSLSKMYNIDDSVSIQ